MTDTGSHREAHRGTALTYLHRNWTAGIAINLYSRRRREVALGRQVASVRTTNEEARRRASDTGPEVRDLTGIRLRESSVRRWEAVVRQNNEEARRMAKDAQSNWSTNAECPPHGNPRVYELDPRQDVHESTRWSGFEYRADHFTWTHRCYKETCNWNFVAQHDVLKCQAYNSRWMSKYLMEVGQPVVFHHTV